jgi:hypothetical protein
MAPRSLLLVVLIAAFGWVGGSQAAVSQTLYAWFDVDGGLQFRYADSSNVGSTIPPGTYIVNLNSNGADDYAVDHIFHLSGPGVDFKATNTNTQATFSVTFQPGATYIVQDDLDPKIRQTILATNATPVGGTATTTTTATSTKKTPKPTSSDIVGSGIVPFRGKLAATVNTAGKLALTIKGKPVGTLKAGLYTFTVVDASAKSSFAIQKLKAQPVMLTGAGYKGTHVATINLKAGQWWFFSPPGTRHYFIVNR